MKVEDILEQNDYYKQKVKNTANSFNDFLIQTGNTYLGKPMSKNEYKIMINSILENLNIISSDDILDLGCGNGLVTQDIAKHAKHIVGFDLSPDLLAVANENHQRNNIDYILCSITDIDFHQYSAKKFYMYSVIQSLEHKTFREFLQKISSQKESFTFLISDIPDREKIFNFYHTKDRRDFLFKELIENKKSHLGTWWYKEHIVQICEDLALTIDVKEQNSLLHTSHYRFDVIISK